MQFLFLFAGLNDMGTLFDAPENFAIVEFLMAFVIHRRELKPLNILLMFPILFGLVFATIVKRRSDNE